MIKGTICFIAIVLNGGYDGVYPLFVCDVAVRLRNWVCVPE